MRKALALTSQRNLKGVTMSSTRKLSSRLTQLLELFNRNDDWLIVIIADPDAMASAWPQADHVPSYRESPLPGSTNFAADNLAMIRYLRIPCFR